VTLGNQRCPGGLLTGLDCDDSLDPGTGRWAALARIRALALPLIYAVASHRRSVSSDLLPLSAKQEDGVVHIVLELF
jgi:hypothetical protein